MGLESAPQSLGRIDPASLIGRPEQVVTPNAVELLSNAVRNGAITASDITARIQQEPAQREKANLETMLAKEGQTPEAQALRQKGQAVTSQQLDLQQAQLKYGPAIQYFQMIAPEAGIPVPTDAKGNPDYAKMAEVGAKLFAWKTKKQTAMEQLQPVEWKEGTSDTGEKVLLKFNKAGRLITPELEQQLGSDVIAPFADVTPGTVAPAAPAAKPAAPATPPSFQAPAASQAEAVSRDQQLSKFLPPSSMVQPKTGVQATPTVSPVAPAAAPTITPHVGEKIPGVGISLGAQKKPEAAPGKEAAELAALQADKQAIQQLKDIIANKDINVVGPGAGSWLARGANQIGAAIGLREKEFESQDKLMQGINKKVLEGAQAMKGNLSDKDIRFLKESFPTLTSTENVWTNFLDNWGRMIDLNEQIIRGTAPKGASIFEQARTNMPAAPATGAVAPQGQMGPVINLPGRGPVQRGADGLYYPAIQ